MSNRKISDQTRRTRAKRAEQRKDYPEFYQRHTEQAGGTRCRECGKILQGGNTSEIPHIFSKSLSPEIATDDDNILKYLCQDCHAIFDQSMAARSQMKCFQESLEQYESLKNKIVKHTNETFFYETYKKD